MLRGVREIRSRQNIVPKTKIEFVVRCDTAIAELLMPMQPYFETLAGATARELGPGVTAPPTSRSTSMRLTRNPAISVLRDGSCAFT